jgi:hypothetical protein
VKITPEIDFLEQVISDNICKLKPKVSSNKSKTFWINGASISLGVLVTLTLGIDVPEYYEKIQKNLALILGGLLTIINGLNALYDYKKLWVRQKSTLLDLYQLQNELLYRKSKSSHVESNDLFDKYQLIWEKGNNEWINIIKTSQNSHDSNNKNPKNSDRKKS